MEFAYNDLLRLHRPVHDGDVFSRRHPKMARLNRAKLFAPFAALTGFEEAVRAKEVPYVPKRVLAPEAAAVLNGTLNRLSRSGPMRVKVEYFEVCTDKNHDACGRMGLYHTLTGVVRKVDPTGRFIMIGDRQIPFDAIGTLIILEDMARHTSANPNSPHSFA